MGCDLILAFSADIAAAIVKRESGNVEEDAFVQRAGVTGVSLT